MGLVGMARDITERKKAEEKLRSLSAVVKQSSEGMAVSDLDGILTFANNAWCKMHGYKSSKELLGKNLAIFYTKEQLEYEVKPFNEKVKQDGAHSGEVGHITKDGKPFPTLMGTTILKDEQGKPYALVGIARDITERKRIEKALNDRVEFEKIVASISTSFINLALDEVDAGIEDALGSIGEFSGVDRSYLFRLFDDGTKTDNTHEWCAEGIVPQIENLEGLQTQPV
jgi:PAS domain S-box-containing protein